jgi:hypothetical protein
MKISLHYQISFLKASFGMLLFLFPMTVALTAQEITHSEHQAKTQTKIVDIVRDPPMFLRLLVREGQLWFALRSSLRR